MRWGVFVVVAACGRIGLDTSQPIGDASVGDARVVDAGADAAVHVLVGDTRSEQCSDNHPPGLAEASSFVATSSGRVTSLSIDYPAGDATELVLALYDDDATAFAPHTLLATATVTGGGAIGAGVLTAPTDQQPSVVQGTRYWISVFCRGGTVCFFRYTYTPGGSTSMCGTTGMMCSATTSSCTVHSASSTLVVPEQTWTLGGSTFGLSVNSYWASGA